jgi:replication factor C large subunit
MQPWIRKHSPKNAKDLIGQDSGMRQLRDFVLNFKKQKKRAMLLYGPTGTGKTAAVHALAKELDLELIELNASDFRNEAQISLVLGGAVNQQSLFFRGKIILVDEVDGLAGREDRGGIGAITKLIDKTSFPMVLTANEPWDSKFGALRSRSILVQFDSLTYPATAAILKNVAAVEGIIADDLALKALARRSSGDARSAINDLQSLSEAKMELTEQSLQDLGERNRKESLPQALTLIFKTTQAAIARSALDNVDEDIDTSFLWVDENLPKEYTKSIDLALAYESLAKADVYRGRIRRWQHWGFLVYASALLTAGVAVAKIEKYHTSNSYTQTMRILKIWQANQKFQKRKAIAEKVAAQTHSSKKEVLKSTMPYLKVIFKKDKKQAALIAQQFELDREEVDWLKN